MADWIEPKKATPKLRRGASKTVEVVFLNRKGKEIEGEAYYTKNHGWRVPSQKKAINVVRWR